MDMCSYIFKCSMKFYNKKILEKKFLQRKNKIEFMSVELKEMTPLEMTLNLAKLTQKDSWRWKAKQCIKRIRKFVLREFKKPGTVKIDEEINKFILKNGMHNIPRKMRVKLSREISDKDSKLVYSLELCESQEFNVGTVKEE